MRVLEHHQHRPVPRLGFELAEQRLEQLLALALRAEIEVRGGTRQRQQLAQQRDIVVVPRAGGEQSAQFAEFGSTVSSRANPAACSSCAMNG